MENEKPKYEIRNTCVVVNPDGDALFSEGATKIEIVDEAAGEFLEISQTDDGVAKIRIDREEWPAIKEAIDLMMGKLR